MADDLSGAVLDGRYRVIEPIAEGAMGVVYRAERVKLGRIVAVKVLHDELPQEISGRKRFEIEAVAMAKLEHPHCAAVLDVGIHDDRPYVVMDFVSGPNLKDVIAEGPLPIPRAVEIVRQVLSGLAHAHEHGIIHRDIKPANLILSQKAGLGDHVKILDFGLARFNAESSNLTTGIVVGTPSYMAPEQIRGVAIDPRTDLYACGVLLFELLTGQKPFHSETDDPIEVCTMHLKKPPPRLAQMQPGIEFGGLEAVVARALAKDPAERYASAEVFADALEIVPRRRISTPMAGVATSKGPVATPSGWSVPADTSALAPQGAAPDASPVPIPTADASPSAPPGGAAPVVTAPVPVPATDASPSAPPVGAAPVVAAPVPVPAADASPSAPPVGAAPVVAVSDTPVAAPVPAVAAPIAFDLSRVVPRPPDAPVDDAPPTPAPRTDPAPTMAFHGAPPAGPSPLATPDLPPSAAPVMVEAPLPPIIPLTRNQVVIAGSGLGLLVVVIAIVATVTGGSSKNAVVDAAFETGATEPPGSDTIEQQLDRAHALVDQGKPDAAIEHLLASRRVFPTDARLAYMAGKLYFAKLWSSAGLKQFRDVLRLDPTFRADPELIKTVLRGFITQPDDAGDLAAFLRDDIGAPARPYLEETARTHPRASTRARAASLLERIR